MLIDRIVSNLQHGWFEVIEGVNMNQAVARSMVFQNFILKQLKKVSSICRLNPEMAQRG